MKAAYDLIWSFSYGAVTIDAICERARVKKGSFYYFFESKADLAVSAIEAWRDERNKVLDVIFHPDVTPLERIWRYIDFVVERQLAAYEANGQVLGCPLFALGSEISTQHEELRSLIHEILTNLCNRFETAIKDAQACGEIEGDNAAMKTRLLWSFYEGTLTRARIENNPELVRMLVPDALALLGARRLMKAVA